MMLTTREGDHPVATLGPDAMLVVDASTCIVLITPERRTTITNVADWQEQLGVATSFARIYQEDAELRSAEGRLRKLAGGAS
jgi:hypothetical protein